MSHENTCGEFRWFADKDFRAAKKSARPKEFWQMQVILADNQAIYRAGIARVLAAEVATEVVAECASFRS